MYISENNKTSISFVIPTLNGERSLGNTLDSIIENAPSFPFEIIIVDHGSVDRTVSIANKRGAKLIRNYKPTIASSRNAGVLISNGEILIFLDDDVLLTQKWNTEIQNVILELKAEPLTLTGSNCVALEKNNWFAKYWFNRTKTKRTSYINSGHLITTRILFDSINGFNEILRTAEDHDFSLRAKRFGANVKNNPNLLVYHVHFPTNIRSFIARERWHGSEDFRSLKNIIHSKEAIFSISILLLLFSVVSLSIFTLNLLYFLGYFSLTFGISSIITLKKFGFKSFKYFLFSSIICNFYIAGRIFALFDLIIKRKHIK